MHVQGLMANYFGAGTHGRIRGPCGLVTPSLNEHGPSPLTCGMAAPPTRAQPASIPKKQLRGYRVPGPWLRGMAEH